MLKIGSGALLLLALFASLPLLAATPTVEVEALLPPGAAVLKVDGKRKMLRAGESFGYVTLVSARTNSATIRVGGKTRTVGLSRHIGSSYEPVQEKRVTIQRDKRMQYLTNVSLNGRAVLALVDTGASTVALSSKQAKAVGIEYYGGEPIRVTTAGGVVNGYLVTLRSVNVGGITVENVQATITEGEYPDMVLLGMTYLRHVKMEEQDGVLSLSRMH